MPNALSPQLLAQMFSQESEDPFLTLLTLTHPSITTVRLVNNTEDITSRSNVFRAFPFRIRLAPDDGETLKEVSIEFDNVSLELIDELRTITSTANVTLEMILASLPNIPQMTISDLKIGSISYNSQRISARLFFDSFLQTEMTCERYTPKNFPGLF